MLTRKTYAPLPAVCMVALLAIVVLGFTTHTQGVAEAAGISPIQGVKIVPGQDSSSCCGPNCQPNFRYWGYWPTVWRRWPQQRPDITFPEAEGLERLPAPEGVKPEPLPKEEKYISPTAPQPGGDYLPPVGEGPATGPGEPGAAPFQLEPGFDPGSGFDQPVPGMENLPDQPMTPGTMPNEGKAPSLTPPAETPPSTDKPPAPATPAPNKGSADPVPDSSVLTLRARSASDSKEPTVEENLIVRAETPLVSQSEKIQLIQEKAVESEPLTSETVRAEVPTKDSGTDESVAEAKQSAFEPVRQTAYESPAEPWAVPKAWKSQRSHTDDTMSEMRDSRMAELQQPQPRKPAPEPDDMKMAEPPEPEEWGKTRDNKTPIGLDGYCPVDLVRGEVWTLGDSRFAVEFEGRTYHMCGPQQHRAFRSNPERYAPVNAGNDPVLSFEENARKAGRTESCAVFEGRLYMFVNAQTMARFQADPKRYTRALQRAKD
ncbi:MAG: hypothetical protein JXM70_28440 [Pirellulales bacterium]|nr:hypothetical protein [Pirellulales bacterium]